jgi:hypothetical protein
VDASRQFGRDTPVKKEPEKHSPGFNEESFFAAFFLFSI